MLYWEWGRRLATLRTFRGNICVYFSNLRYENHLYKTVPVETETSQRARFEINSVISEVVDSLALVGESATMYYSPPPLRGGIAAPIHLIQNLFLLGELQIDPRLALDALDRAIGQYGALRPKLFRQLFNPFFWVEWLLGKLLAVPFRILAAAGFNAGRIEHSFVGKFAKAVLALVGFVAAFLATLHYLGWLAPVRDFVNALFRRSG
jgi:hypothetical protein